MAKYFRVLTYTHTIHAIGPVFKVPSFALSVLALVLHGPKFSYVL